MLKSSGLTLRLLWMCVSPAEDFVRSVSIQCGQFNHSCSLKLCWGEGSSGLLKMPAFSDTPGLMSWQIVATSAFSNSHIQYPLDFLVPNWSSQVVLLIPTFRINFLILLYAGVLEIVFPVLACFCSSSCGLELLSLLFWLLTPSYKGFFHFTCVQEWTVTACWLKL